MEKTPLLVKQAASSLAFLAVPIELIKHPLGPRHRLVPFYILCFRPFVQAGKSDLLQGTLQCQILPECPLRGEHLEKVLDNTAELDHFAYTLPKLAELVGILLAILEVQIWLPFPRCQLCHVRELVGANPRQYQSLGKVAWSLNGQVDLWACVDKPQQDLIPNRLAGLVGEALLSKDNKNLPLPFVGVIAAIDDI